VVAGGSVRTNALLRVLRLVGAGAVLVLVFVAALTAVYALPQLTIPRHLRESVAVLRSEGVYPSRFVSGTAFLQDNYTDALMLDTTFREPTDSPLVAAMSGTHGGPATIIALAQTATGERRSPTHYSYYWNGYQVILRPLIILFDYSQIRNINLIALLMLTALVAYLLWQTVGWKGPAAFLASLLACGFIIVPWSLQYSSMTYLMLLAMLTVLVCIKHGVLAQLNWEIFFIVGMLAAFFDLLTVPLLSLGMPLAVVLIVRSQAAPSNRFRSQLLYSVTASVLWSAGYVVSWLAKLVIGQAILSEDVLARALHQFTLRADTIAEVSRAAVLAANFKLVYPMYVVEGLSPTRMRLELATGAFILLAAAVLFFSYMRRTGFTMRGFHVASVLLVVPLPYIWYWLASNHSFIHARYTYRIQAIAVFAVLYLALCVVETIVTEKPSA